MWKVKEEVNYIEGETLMLVRKHVRDRVFKIFDKQDRSFYGEIDIDAFYGPKFHSGDSENPVSGEVLLEIAETMKYLYNYFLSRKEEDQ